MARFPKRLRTRRLAEQRCVSFACTGIICLASLLAPSASAKDNAVAVPPEVSLHHFEKIDGNVYSGSKPHTDEDFQYLQSLHVHYIVSARFLPFLSGSEKRKAKRYGMTLLSFPMNASPIPPSEEHVDRILETLHDPKYQPVYLHCVLGRDRTGLIAGLYRIYYLGIPKGEAWQDMLQTGFHTWWFVRGLNVYFKDHADPADRP